MRHGSVLSPVMLNAMTNEIANVVRGENRRPGMKTLISAYNVLMWEEKAKRKLKKNLISGILLKRSMN
jgi:hypothetical protein